MSWSAPQGSLQGLDCLDMGGGLYASSSKVGTGYPSPQPGSSGHHRGPDIEYLAEGWGSPPEGPRPVTVSSSAKEPPNGRTGHHNAEDIRKGRSGGRFPHKLRRLMGTPDAAGLIGWNNKGDALIVRNHKALEAACILGQHFNHNSWDAVVRQLHYYGFEKANRVKGGEKYHVYRHCHFLREHPELLDKMKPISQGRETVKDSAAKLRSEIEDINKRLVHAEESIKVLKIEKAALEEENKKLKDENSILRFLNSLLEPLHWAASTMWATQPVRRLRRPISEK
ncbi:hypothetical protein FRC05_006885 [Tulasnella sp. 425]|nr:hypothetical protein FRC05_006885 [Tulasnella sp. 425]